MTDAGVDCVNIDKSLITDTMTYHMKLSQILTHTITTAATGQFEFYGLFIGLKNASQNFDTYRIYINHNQVYSQTDSIYEQALVTAMKPKAKMFRHHIYNVGWSS